MDKISNNSKTLSRLTWFCIVFGLVEIFVLIFITSSIFAIIPGLITIIPAYISLIDEKIKWKYFVGIWSIVKYNPITLAMISFILEDLFGGNINSGQFEFIAIILISIFMAGISNFVIGIILMVKTRQQVKLVRLEKR